MVDGVAAHAGIEPQKGASAVHELAHQILRINALQDLARGISVNVVQVSGGLRSNVDPRRSARRRRRSRADGRRRPPRSTRRSARLRPIDPRTTRRVAAAASTGRRWNAPTRSRVCTSRRATSRASSGTTLQEGGTGGGSDGNFTAALGVPTLDGLGAIGDGAHALHEHVDVDSLPDRAALVAGLIATLKIGPGSTLLYVQHVKTALLLGVLSALLLFIGEALGGAQGLVLGFLFAVGHQLRARTGSRTRSSCAMYSAQEVGPGHRLYDIVRRLAQRARPAAAARATSFRSRRRTRSPPAAIPQHAAVAATEGILQILTTTSSKACSAHELAHVKHRDILISSVAATLAAAIMMISRFAMFFGGGRATTAKAATRSRCWRRSSWRRSRRC